MTNIKKELELAFTSIIFSLPIIGATSKSWFIQFIGIFWGMLGWFCFVCLFDDKKNKKTKE